MNREERMKLVKAMEFIVRQVNGEDVLDGWLTMGVADGDIDYGDLTVTDEDDDYYAEDENFRDLMKTFLWCMKEAHKSGGLYCDGIVS